MLNSLSPSTSTLRTFRLYPDHEIPVVSDRHRITRVDINENNVKDGADHHLFARSGSDFDQLSYWELHQALKKLGAAEKPVKASRVAKELEPPSHRDRPYTGFQLMDVKCDMFRPTKQEFRLEDDAILFTAQLPADFQIAEPYSAKSSNEGPPITSSEPSSSRAFLRDLLVEQAEELGWELTLSPSLERSS